jgi:alkanesulfonate monooxygenase SsuD/methylene tetrahydromethanopterin reductase-like flavin-dependent oxidoreductase (luciferase family)
MLEGLITAPYRTGPNRVFLGAPGEMLEQAVAHGEVLVRNGLGGDFIDSFTAAVAAFQAAGADIDTGRLGRLNG